MTSSPGELIARLREELDISQEELSRRLAQRGFELSRQSISNWETKEYDNGDPSLSNPRFVRALAESLGTTDVRLLHQLGFPTVPEGYTLEDVELARVLSDLPFDRRRKLLSIFLAIIDIEMAE